MEKEYVMKTAQTILEQLATSIPTPVLMSWGIGGFVATVFKNKPALILHVNGRLHAGLVIIALNGSDYYEVYLQNSEKTRLVSDEVGCEELGELIDEAIESGTDKAEYAAFCEQQRQKLFLEAL